MCPPKSAIGFLRNMVVVIVDQLPAPVLDEPEEELEEDDEEYESDFMKIGVFLANVLMLGSFIVSLTFLGAAKNLGGASMIFSFILAIPVSLFNAWYFFAPRDGDEENTEEEGYGPIAPYVILVVMIVILTLTYGLMSLRR